jgi:methionine synthase I (cobalamin-dependent)
MKRLDQMLCERGCLVADGGMGSNLYAMGLAIGDAPELWLTQHPERVSAVHQAFVDAGADIILSNTFGANRRRLALVGAEARVSELNRRGAELARTVADGPGRDVIVAGAVGPLGARMAEASGADAFEEQMIALKAGGVDLIWLETMMSLGEIRAAQAAAARVGLPYVVTASFDGHGRMLDGTTAAEVARMLTRMSVPPAAIGCNCGDGPKSTGKVIAAMRAAAPDAVLIAKASASLPRLVDGRAVYVISDAEIEFYASDSYGCGARIIGGCCGMTPGHIATLRQALAPKASSAGLSRWPPPRP